MDKKKLKNFFLALTIILLFFNHNAEAYFDPGSGSFIIQSLIALGSAVLIYLSYPLKYLKKIKDFFTSKINKNNKENESGQNNRENK